MYDQYKVYEIPLGDIFADPEFNIRGVIDPVSCIELSKDIKARNLDQPITIQPWTEKPGKKFRVLAGHRRFKAHQIIYGEDKTIVLPGSTTPNSIRALIRENISEIDATIINITENIQRQDLNILQEARGIDKLHRAGWNAQEVATKIGKSYGWVQIRFYLLELPPEIQHEAEAGLITQMQIRELWSLSSYDQQMEYVRKIKDKKLKNLSREVKPDSVKLKNEKKARSPAEIEAMMDLIRDTLYEGMNGPETKYLAWAAGNISDLEVHKYLSAQASRMGKFYLIPEQYQGTHAKAV